MTDYADSDSAYTDNSPFVRLLQTEGQVRLLAAMLVNPNKEQSTSRLIDKTGMVRATVLDNLRTLQDMGLVEQTDRVGGANLYQLTSHPALPHLRKAQLALLTDEDSRSEAPEPEKHDDQTEGPLGSSFGEPPELSADEIDTVDLTS